MVRSFVSIIKFKVQAHDRTIERSNDKMLSKRSKNFWLFLLISLFIHVGVIIASQKLFSSQNNESVKIEPKPLMIDLVKEPAPKQIVDIPKPVHEVAPEKASAQALYNQKVKEEQVTAQPKVGPSNKTEPKAQPVKKETPKKEEPQKVASKKEEPKQEPVVKKTPTNDPATKGMGDSGGDFLQNFKVGNKTYINAQANPNIGYFVELKRKFRLTFNPSILRNYVSQIHSNKIESVVGMSLNQKGELTEVTIIRGSGINAYDLEGVRTIKQSAPFTAPPSNLLDKDGFLRIAWVFSVSITP